MQAAETASSEVKKFLATIYKFRKSFDLTFATELALSIDAYADDSVIEIRAVLDTNELLL